MDREDRLKLALIAAVLVLDCAGLAILGLRFDWPSATKAIIAWLALMGFGWFYMTRRVDPPISHLLRETAHLLAFSAAGAVLSYLAAGFGGSLIDETLVRWDAALGFEWASYVGFVNDRPWLGMISSYVYLSTLPQVALAAVVLPLIGATERSREFVMAVMIAALIAILVSAILPSAGALAYYRPDPEFLARNAPLVDLAYKDEFFRMRALEIPVLSLDASKGLIAFPSYHVALSVLIALAFRGRWILFLPLAALNFAVILTTPIDGGHHLSDAIGGVVVAVLSLWLATRLRAGLNRQPARQGVPAEGQVPVATGHS